MSHLVLRMQRWVFSLERHDATEDGGALFRPARSFVTIPGRMFDLLPQAKDTVKLTHLYTTR